MKKKTCNCPMIDGFQVTGSSCPVHGLAASPFDEPITADWLKSECGFYGDDLITHRWITHSFRLYFVDRIGSGVVMYTDGDVHYKTRNQVKNLLRALLGSNDV